MFDGEVQRVIRGRERTARITRITLGDQVRQKDRLGGVSNRVYPGVESTSVASLGISSSTWG